jgi:4-phospho-D-threonate 3-dehydrogenase / 4-phospho-D-erythronate 3-dehydrogenase
LTGAGRGPKLQLIASLALAGLYFGNESMIEGLPDRREPVVAVTIGDPAGIGPEIVLKALADPDVRSGCRVLIIGDLAFLRRRMKELSVAVELAADVSADDKTAVQVYDLANLPPEVEIGIEAPVTGRAAAEYIEAAVQLWRQGEIDAVATAPISKRAIALGGYDFPGHTEFLAELTGTDEVAMSFFAGDLRVVLLTTHVPLRQALDQVRTDRIAHLIDFTHEQLSRLLGRPPRLAVAGLNPHASEHGMFGREEMDEIEPAVEDRRADGIDVSGPYSPDTIFLRAYRGEFDGVIACYHDQATIAVKSLSFGSSVNVTLGLPLIRTSVDHGTAFDIAAKGVADESSMKAAIRLAADLAGK